jgi:hypothetical protein
MEFFIIENYPGLSLMRLGRGVYLRALEYQLSELSCNDPDGVFINLVLRDRVGVHIGIYCRDGEFNTEYWY